MGIEIVLLATGVPALIGFFVSILTWNGRRKERRRRRQLALEREKLKNEAIRVAIARKRPRRRPVWDLVLLTVTIGFFGILGVWWFGSNWGNQWAGVALSVAVIFGVWAAGHRTGARIANESVGSVKDQLENLVDLDELEGW